MLFQFNYFMENEYFTMSEIISLMSSPVYNIWNLYILLHCYMHFICTCTLSYMLVVLLSFILYFIQVLDASWYMPDEQRNPIQEYQVLSMNSFESILI